MGEYIKRLESRMDAERVSLGPTGDTGLNDRRWGMTPEIFVGVMEVLVAFALLLWFFASPWRSFLTDVSRDHYFTLRDRLFLMAADGRIEFSNAAYCGLRNRLNTDIRFAHLDTMERLIAIVMHGPLRHRSPSLQRLLDSIDTLEEATVKDDLQEILQTANNVRINQMLASSPLLCLLILAGLFVALPVALVRKPNWISELRDRTEQVACDSIALADLDALVGTDFPRQLPAGMAH